MIIHITCHAKCQSVSKLLLPSSYNIMVFTSYSNLAGESLASETYRTLLTSLTKTAFYLTLITQTFRNLSTII